MAMSNSYIRKAKSNKYKYYYLLKHEMELINDKFDFIQCTLGKTNNFWRLTCHGTFSQLDTIYEYRITYDGKNAPKVKILSPELIEKPPHVYEGNYLCLYYPKEQPWNSKEMSLYSTIVPWTHEWIVFYELYLIIGKWIHPEIKHRSSISKNMEIEKKIHKK